MTTKPLDLEAIRARTEATTAEPWHLETDWCDCGDGYGCSHGEFPHALRLPVHTASNAHQPCDPSDSLDSYRHKASDFGDLSMADAEFIAHARQDIPALIAEVDRLRARLAADTTEVP